MRQRGTRWSSALVMLLVVSAPACGDDGAAPPGDGGGARDAAGSDAGPIGRDAGDAGPETFRLRHGWSLRFGAGMNDGAVLAGVDTTGNVYVAGTFIGDIDVAGTPLRSAGAEDIVIASFSGADGTLRWAYSFGGPQPDYAVGATIDDAGNMYVVGQFQGDISFERGAMLTSAGGSGDIFAASFTSAGAHRWSMRFGGDATDTAFSVDETAGALAVGGFFGATVAVPDGTSLTSAGLEDVLVLVLDEATGVVRRAARAGGPSFEVATGVAIDASGLVYATGRTGGGAEFGGTIRLKGAGGPDGFVAALGASGWTWAHAIASPADDGGTNVTIEPDGAVLVTGTFSETVDFGGGARTSGGAHDMFLARYDAAGGHRLSLTFGAAGNDQGNALTLDPAGDIVVTGIGSGIDLGGGPLEAGHDGDIFVASLQTNGTHRWSLGLGAEGGTTVAAPDVGHVFLAGGFQETIDLAGTTLTSVGASDAFVALLLVE